jgi:hypothetical protein
MPDPQDFVGIDSSCVDGPNTQVATAILQRLEQNNRYLIEWRGPTLSYTWPADSEAPGGPPFPRHGFATWACVGPFRYFVPDLGSDQITFIDVEITGAVVNGTEVVKFVPFSVQGSNGQAPQPRQLDLDAVTLTGAVIEKFGPVAVRGGWNDMYLALQSEVQWDSVQATDKLAFDGGSPPRLIRDTGSGRIDTYIPIDANLPFIAIKIANPNDDKVIEEQSGSPYTMAYAEYDASGHSTFAYIAEITNQAQLPPAAVVFGAGEQITYWADLAYLEIYSLSFTPYNVHPDRANDPMLRWYQMVGSNVANVFWKGSRLVDLRQTQSGTARPIGQGLDYPGGWRILYFNLTASTQLVRELALNVDLREPTEGENQVQIEVCFPYVYVIASLGRADNYQPLSGGLDFTVELYNVTTATVVETRLYENFSITPSVDLLGRTPMTHVWTRMMMQEQEDFAWARPGGNGQPWSHDQTVPLQEIGIVVKTMTFRLPLTDWSAVRGSGQLYAVRIYATDNETGRDGTYLAAGPMTARICWGVS